jgi:hypothetical protein
LINESLDEIKFFLFSEFLLVQKFGHKNFENMGNFTVDICGIFKSKTLAQWRSTLYPISTMTAAVVKVLKIWKLPTDGLNHEEYNL